MQVNFDVPYEQAEVESAYAELYGYRELVPNTSSRPAPEYAEQEYEDKDGETKTRQVVVNQADIDAYEPQVPNPVSKADFMIGVMRQRLDEVVSGHRTRMAKHDQLHAAQ